MTAFAKTALNVLAVLCTIYLLWVVVSFIDINAHNLTTGEYLPFNFFTVFFGTN